MAKARMPATMTAPDRAEELRMKRSRRAVGTASIPWIAGEKGRERLGESLRKLLGGGGAAIENLEARAPKLSREASALVDRTGAVATAPKDESGRRDPRNSRHERARIE